MRLGTRVISATETADGVHLELSSTATSCGRTPSSPARACTPTASRAACGLDPTARIVPFRGEYFELSPTAADLVNGLVYPVPDPRFPFLGVHLTRMIGGGVHAGPNAVLALAREGYTWRDVDLRDTVDAPDLAGPVAAGRRNAGAGRPRGGPVAVPARVRAQPGRPGPRDRARTTCVPSPAGVRAQAVARDGRLVDDFLLQRTAAQVHVLNAPSPAATCALEIADHVVGQLTPS